MMDTEAFREFKTGLSLLRDNYSAKALQHIQRAAELEKQSLLYVLTSVWPLRARNENGRMRSACATTPCI